MLEQAVLDDINASPAAGSITRSMLEQAVLDDINASPAAGSITRSMLEQAVLDDINASRQQVRLQGACWSRRF